MAERKPTIDERIEAIAQSVELFIHVSREDHATLAQSQIKTEKMIVEMVESINSLARIAHAHENRITNLEDR